MHKNIVKAIVIFYTSLLLLGGCVPQAVVHQAEVSDPSDGTFTVVFPAEMKEAPAELMKKVQNIGYYERFGKDHFDINAVKWSFATDRFTVEHYRAREIDRREFAKVSISYTGTIEQVSSSTLKLIPRTVNSSAKADIFGRTYKVQFPPNEIMRRFDNAEIRKVFEIDSEFNSDATYANFARLTRKETLREGYKDPVTGKIYTERFWLKVNNLEIPVTVATYPYRNGSKVVINADVPAQRNGSIFDFSIPAKAIQLELERIVKS